MHEAAGYLRRLAGCTHRGETVCRCVGDRDDHLGRVALSDRALEVVQRTEDPRTPDAPSAQRWIVVDEPDDAHAGCLAQLASEAASRPAGAPDQDARVRRGDGAVDPLDPEPKQQPRASDEYRREDSVE